MRGMVKIRTIQIRLTRQQYEQIKNNSITRGFNSLSAYLRHQALNRDETIENKVHEIHQALIARPKDKKNKDYFIYGNEL